MDYVIISEWAVKKAVEFGYFDKGEVEKAITTDGILVNKYGRYLISQNIKENEKNNNHNFSSRSPFFGKFRFSRKQLLSKIPAIQNKIRKSFKRK